MPTRTHLSLAEQLRTARHRRRRRRRGLLLAGTIALVGVGADQLLHRASAQPVEAPSGGAVRELAPTEVTVATGLQPGLVDAFARAQSAAFAAGHALTITSGFRTAGEQSALLEAEVAERGSLEEALRWVFPPERSMHVRGLAVDVGDGPAADWLDDNGARWGLCRTLDWEWWHFEWRARWEETGHCPAPATSPEDAPTS